MQPFLVTVRALAQLWIYKITIVSLYHAILRKKVRVVRLNSFAVIIYFWISDGNKLSIGLRESRPIHFNNNNYYYLLHLYSAFLDTQSSLYIVSKKITHNFKVASDLNHFHWIRERFDSCSQISSFEQCFKVVTLVFEIRCLSKAEVGWWIETQVGKVISILPVSVALATINEPVTAPKPQARLPQMVSASKVLSSIEPIISFSAGFEWTDLEMRHKRTQKTQWSRSPGRGTINMPMWTLGRYLHEL